MSNILSGNTEKYFAIIVIVEVEIDNFWGRPLLGVSLHCDALLKDCLSGTFIARVFIVPLLLIDLHS